MLKLRTLACLLSVGVPWTTACDTDSMGAQSHAPEASKWDFANTVDQAGFNAKLKDLDGMAAEAGRGGLPANQTRGPAGFGAALGILDRFAGVEDAREAASAVNSADCATLLQIFAVADGAPERKTTTGFSLSDGESCGDAVKGLKSYYSQSLDALKAQVGWLKKLAPGSELCGMRVDALPVDAKAAAIAFKLTPAGLTTGQHYDQSIYGAANDDQVGYMTTLSAGCDKTKGVCTSSPEFSIVARSEAVGQLAAKTLDLKNSFAVQFKIDDSKGGESRDVVTEISTASSISGLNGTDPLKANESTNFVLTGDPTEAPGAEPFKATLALNLEEMAEGVLKVSGSLTTNESGAAPHVFSAEFKRNGDQCSVETTKVPAAESPASGISYFKPEELVGNWVGPCGMSSLGDLGGSTYEERSLFDGTRVTRVLTTYSDNECFAGKETSTITLTGTYVVSGALPDGKYDGVSEYGLDQTYDGFDLTISNDNFIANLNRAKVCGKGDWKKDEPVHFAPGVCYFDIGGNPLLSLYSMQRTAEFTTVRPDASHQILTFSQSSFSGGETAATRARLASGSGKTMKLDGVRHLQ